MTYKVCAATRETHAALPCSGSMAYNATNGGSQKATRESDAVIVPEIPGNAGGGKDGTQAGLVQGTHFLYTGKGKRWEQNWAG